LRLYQVLGLRRTDASADEVKRAYRRTATRVHPDRNRNDPDSTAKFQSVQYAYSVLSEPRLRSIYDSYGEQVQQHATRRRVLSCACSRRLPHGRPLTCACAPLPSLPPFHRTLPQGVKMYESYVSFAGSEDGSSSISVSDPLVMITGLCTVLGILVGLVTALAAAVYVKLQDPHAPALALMLTPLWILDGLGLLSLYIFLTASTRAKVKEDGWKKAAPSGSMSLMLLQLLLLIAWEVRTPPSRSTCLAAVAPATRDHHPSPLFPSTHPRCLHSPPLQVLLVLRTDSVTPQLPYMAVFAPIYLLEVTNAFAALPRLKPSTYEAERNGGSTILPYTLYAAREVSWLLSRAAFLLLLTLKLDGALHGLWLLPLSPLWLYLAIDLLVT
jgi:hypothetical protein